MKFFGHSAFAGASGSSIYGYKWALRWYPSVGYSHLFQLGLAQKLEGAGMFTVLNYFMNFTELGIMQSEMGMSVLNC